MFFTIYKITNLIDQKTYIGKHQTDNLSDGYFGSGKHLKRAITKHGVENFCKEILHIFETEAEMNAKEAELVTEEFASWSNTYNICVGGQGGFGYINQNGLLASTEKRKKNGSKGAKKSIDTKVGIFSKEFQTIPKTWCVGNKNSGWKHSTETLEKMSKIQKNIDRSGAKNFTFGKCWVKNDALQLRKLVRKDEAIPDGWVKGSSNSYKYCP